MRLKYLCLSSGVVVLSALSFGQSTFFIPLPNVPGGMNPTIPNAISEDGSTVVGSMQSTSYGGPEAFIWHRSTGVASLYQNNPTNYNLEAHGVSADGSIVVGEMDSSGIPKGFSWTQGGGLVRMDGWGGPGGICYNYGISGDGAAIIGETATASGPLAFRWTQSGGYTLLGDLPGGVVHSQALSISHDGSVIVGLSSSLDGPFSADAAFRWTEATGMQSLGTLPGGANQSTAYAVSADGKTIVGRAKPGGLGSLPFRWTEATGMVDIGVAGGGLGSAYGVSQDGSIIVGGQMANSNPEEAFVADTAHGFRWLRQVLTENGLGSQFAGWRLSRATAVTVDPNGFTVITGYGVNPDGAFQGFVAAVPEPSSLLAIAAGIGILLRRRKR